MKWILLTCLTLVPASGLIFRDGPSPAANTETAPTGPYANSGWQHQIRYTSFHGTIISPKHFITAQHVFSGAAEISQNDYFNGVEDRVFAVKGSKQIGTTDLRVFEIWETFADYAELYTNTDEVGKGLVICGRGVGRGTEISGKGWQWGATSTALSRWGRNDVSGSVNSPVGELLYFNFSNVLNQDEASATNRDSGGGWFVKTGGTWKLAAVTYAVDGPYSTIDPPASGNGFFGAFYDAAGLYLKNGSNWDLISPLSNFRRTNSYGTRVSTYAPAIAAEIQSGLDFETQTPIQKFDAWMAGASATGGLLDDFDDDGRTNIEEYLAESDPSDDDVALAPFSVTLEPGNQHLLSLRETLDLDGRGLTTVVQSSSDLASWTDVTAIDPVVKVRVPAEGVSTRELLVPDGSQGLYYRLKILY